MLAKGHFVREKQVEIFGVHEWGFCHEALDMTLGLFLTKVEGFVLIQKNYECSKRQQFGHCCHCRAAESQAAMRRLTAIQPLMALKGRFLIDATAGPDPKRP